MRPATEHKKFDRLNPVENNDSAGVLPRRCDRNPVHALSILLIFSVLLTGGCIEETGAVEFRSGPDSDVILVDEHDESELPVADRHAFLVLHEGILTSQGDRAVEIDAVYDAEIYAGPDDDGLGDPHWITRVRVLDTDGEPLWTQRTNSLFQLLEFLSVVMEEQSPIDLSIQNIYQLVRQQYPELLRFVTKVPRNIPGAETYILEIGDEQGEFEQLFSHPIEELEAMAEPPSPDFHHEIDSIISSGPPSDRLNVAILGDGYTEEERHIFEGDAQAVTERFLDASPMREHRDLFNIKSIWTPSEESGAGYDCNYAGAPSDCEHDFRDTVFDTTFVIPAIADQLNMDMSGVSDRVAMPLRLDRIYEVAALAHYDEIIFISNSPKRSGFAGLYVAVVTNFDDRDSFPDVAVHEVGHTLGLLGDEYNIASDACYFNEPTIPLPANISEILDDEVKWSEWVSEETPVPTPESNDHNDAVGAFEGAYNCDFLVRPERHCKMNSSGHDFCAVCAEQMVRRFYSMVDPAPLQPLEIANESGVGIQITAPTRGDGDRYEVNWNVEDGPIFLDQSTITLTGADLPEDEWATVTVSVHNRTEFLKTVDQAVMTEHSFQIRLVDES